VKQWFKNLKKWQKGGLIGCGVGLLFACLPWIGAIPGICSVGGIVANWEMRLHMLPFLIFMYSMYANPIIGFFVYFGAMVVCYGGFGAILGKTQQITNLFWRWLLTGLLTLILLLYYWFNFYVSTLGPY
jgi:hypothetical protein